MERPRVDPEEMLGDDEEEGLLADSEDEGDDGEEMNPAEVVVSILGEIMDEGIPVRFTAHEGDPLIRPAVVRLQRQNEILADISESLRGIAIACGCKLKAETVTADLSKKTK